MRGDSEWVWDSDEKHVVSAPSRADRRYIDQPLFSCFPKLHRTNVYGSNSSTNSEYPVPSPCYRKGKCWKNIDSSTGLRYNGESHDLPAGRAWGMGGGAWSNFACEYDLTANQVKLDPSMDVSGHRTSPRMPLNMVPARRAHHRG